MFAIAFRMMMSPTFERMTVYVSDDESPVDKSDVSPNPAGGQMKALSPMADLGTPEPFVVTRGWSVSCSSLKDLRFVRRVVGIVDQQPVMAAVLEGRLILQSASRLEVALGVRGSNTRQPRERYSY